MRLVSAGDSAYSEVGAGLKVARIGAVSGDRLGRARSRRRSIRDRTPPAVHLLAIMFQICNSFMLYDVNETTRSPFRHKPAAMRWVKTENNMKTTALRCGVDLAMAALAMAQLSTTLHRFPRRRPRRLRRQHRAAMSTTT